MSAHDLAGELIATARSDIKALTNMLDAAAFDDRVFGFHAQQAVEKTMKAWINLLGQPHPYTHDLSRLLQTLQEQGMDVEMYWDFLDLSGYAVRFRYEAFPEGEEPLDRDNLLKDIQGLLGRVEKLMQES